MLTINTAIAILIRLRNHLVDLGIGQVLPQGFHDLTQFVGGDGAGAVFVEDGEGGAGFLREVGGFDVGGHHFEEFWGWIRLELGWCGLVWVGSWELRDER